MEISFIHELLSTHLSPYYNDLVNEDDKDLAEIKSVRAELEKALSEEQLKLSDKYKHLCVLREEYVEFQMQVRILNYGIKIGMELQEAFTKYFNE